MTFLLIAGICTPISMLALPSPVFLRQGGDGATPSDESVVRLAFGKSKHDPPCERVNPCQLLRGLASETLRIQGMVR